MYVFICEDMYVCWGQKEYVLSFYHLGLRNQTEVARLAGRHSTHWTISGLSEILITKIGVLGLTKVKGTLYL